MKTLTSARSSLDTCATSLLSVRTQLAPSFANARKVLNWLQTAGDAKVGKDHRAVRWLTVLGSDINECERGTARCEQKCINIPGSYQCICDRGYTVGQSFPLASDV